MRQQRVFKKLLLISFISLFLFFNLYSIAKARIFEVDLGFFQPSVEFRFDPNTGTWQYRRNESIWRAPIVAPINPLGYWSNYVGSYWWHNLSTAEPLDYGLSLITPGDFSEEYLNVIRRLQGLNYDAGAEYLTNIGKQNFGTVSVDGQTIFASEALKPQIVIDIGGFNASKFNEPPEATCPGGKGTCLEIDWLSQYIGAIYKYGVGLAAILAVVMMMVGGLIWLMSGGSPNSISKAKDFITSAFTGLLLALFSFMLLYIVNPKLIDLAPLTVKQIKPVKLDVNTVLAAEGTSASLGSPATGSGGRVSSSPASDATEQESRNQLAANGIATWESTPGGTDTRDMSQPMNDFLNNRADEWGGSSNNTAFTITGLAETRGRHGPNTVDIDLPNQNFSNWATQGAEAQAGLSWGHAYYQDNVDINGQSYTVMSVFEGGNNTNHIQNSTHIHMEIHPNGWRF